MTASPGSSTAGGNRESRSRRGQAAYDLGRTLNEIRWLLDQAIFFDEALPVRGVSALLRRYVPLVKRLFTDPDAAEVEGLLPKSIDRWKALTDDEELGGDIQETIRRYTSGDPDALFDPTFRDVTGTGRWIVEEIAAGVQARLKDESFLLALLELGLVVDQGLRPLDTENSVFCHRETGSGFRIVKKFCPVAETPLDPNWPLEVRRRWGDLNLLADLPQQLYDLNPERASIPEVEVITREIDEAVERGLGRLDGHRDASRNSASDPEGTTRGAGRQDAPPGLPEADGSIRLERETPGEPISTTQESKESEARTSEATASRQQSAEAQEPAMDTPVVFLPQEEEEADKGSPETAETIREGSSATEPEEATEPAARELGGPPSQHDEPVRPVAGELAPDAALKENHQAAQESEAGMADATAAGGQSTEEAEPAADSPVVSSREEAEAVENGPAETTETMEAIRESFSEAEPEEAAASSAQNPAGFPPQHDQPARPGAEERISDAALKENHQAGTEEEQKEEKRSWVTPLGAGEELPALTVKEFRRLRELKKKIDPKDDYIGESLPILQVFEKIEFFNKSQDLPIVILGPSGAGKSKIARLIHKQSGRKGKFVRDQASDNQASDFSITKGRWVGFGKGHGIQNVPPDGSEGLLQQAAGGTIFIDEIADLTEQFQTFLFEVMDREEISVVSGRAPDIKPDVRLIFATNQEIETLVKTRRLKPDFARRLGKSQIRIPALKDRKEDVLLFIQKELAKYRPTPSFLLALLGHDWPGNVFELLECLERVKSQVGSEGENLSLDHLKGLIPEGIVDDLRHGSPKDLETVLYRYLERLFAQRGLVKGKGLQKEIARIMEVSQSTVSRHLKSES